MKRFGKFEIIPAVIMIVTSLASPVLAAISWSGDVDPSDPSTWNSGLWSYVGHTGYGTMGITGGSDVINNHGYIGYDFGSTGAVTVDGAGSTWTNNGLSVGYDGNGTLNITAGGEVSNGRGYIADRFGTGVVTVDGTGSTLTNNDRLYVGGYGNGTLNITGGGAVSNTVGYIGTEPGSRSKVNVDGSGSAWTNNGYLIVGSEGNGTLNITGGGAVSNDWCYIGHSSGSRGKVTVDGAGSTWTNNDRLSVGIWDNGTLNITNGGLVSVAGTLTIDSNGDGDNSFINMATGGMLALFGDADDSLVDFLGLVGGTGAIRYWDDSVLGWADITGATYGLNYTLEYLTEGDLTGYTMLTVPEPATMLLLGLGGMVLRKRRRT